MFTVAPLLALAAIASASPLVFKRYGNNSAPSYPFSRLTYPNLIDDLASSPNCFFNSFTAWNSRSETDPTGDGTSSYVSMQDAVSQRLVAYTSSQVGSSHVAAAGVSEYTANTPIYIGVDAKSTDPTDGRAAVRLTSKKSYSSGTLIVASFSHMPEGCGTWPAFWATSSLPPWPQWGEIDILEGVGLQEENAMTLHTTAGCAATPLRNAYSGTLASKNCDVNAPDQGKNQGCGFSAPAGSNSYGSGFNANGGGTYAVSWEDSGIAVWFFPASSAAHQSLQRAGAKPDTSTFGRPLAFWSSQGCDIGQHFRDLQLVINTELCGSWAGDDKVWQEGGCAAQTGVQTCKQFVMEHPEAFEQAYWVVDSMRVYGR